MAFTGSFLGKMGLFRERVLKYCFKTYFFGEIFGECGNMQYLCNANRGMEQW